MKRRTIHALTTGGLFVGAAIVTTTAYATWGVEAAPRAITAKASTLGQPGQPELERRPQNAVRVTWSHPRPRQGTVRPRHYRVERITVPGDAVVAVPACAQIDSAGPLRCTELNVPPGTWRYRVTGVDGNWAGPPSRLSAKVEIKGGKPYRKPGDKAATSRLPAATPRPDATSTPSPTVTPAPTTPNPTPTLPLPTSPLL